MIEMAYALLITFPASSFCAEARINVHYRVAGLRQNELKTSQPSSNVHNSHISYKWRCIERPWVFIFPGL